jgi:biopolymer transport protein ExbD
MAMLKRQSKVSDEIPTASMADIAFLLLIFFLTTTVFDQEKGLPLVLPEAQAEEVQVSQKNIIHFLVQEDGSVVVKRGESTAEQVVSPTQVEGIMRQEIANNPEIIAAVKTAPDAPYRAMVAVLDQLQLAAAQRISLQLWEK